MKHLNHYMPYNEVCKYANFPLTLSFQGWDELKWIMEKRMISSKLRFYAILQELQLSWLMIFFLCPLREQKIFIVFGYPWKLLRIFEGDDTATICYIVASSICMSVWSINYHLNVHFTGIGCRQTSCCPIVKSVAQCDTFRINKLVCHSR